MRIGALVAIVALVGCGRDAPDEEAHDDASVWPAEDAAPGPDAAPRPDAAPGPDAAVPAPLCAYDLPDLSHPGRRDDVGVYRVGRLSAHDFGFDDVCLFGADGVSEGPEVAVRFTAAVPGEHTFIVDRPATHLYALHDCASREPFECAYAPPPGGRGFDIPRRVTIPLQAGQTVILVADTMEDPVALGFEAIPPYDVGEACPPTPLGPSLRPCREGAYCPENDLHPACRFDAPPELDALTARRTRTDVRIELTGRDADGPPAAIRIERLTAGGHVIQYGVSVPTEVVEGGERWRVRAVAPFVDQRGVAAVRVEPLVYAGAAPALVAPLDEVPSRGLGAACDPALFLDRCEAGPCFGRCVAGGAAGAYGTGDDVRVVYRAPAPLPAGRYVLSAGDQHRWIETTEPRAVFADDFVFLEGEVDVRLSRRTTFELPLDEVRGVPVEPMPVRARGEPCDGVSDACEAGASCRAGECSADTAPAIERLRARRNGAAYGFDAEGHDPDGDVVGFRLELLVGEGPWLTQERPLPELEHHVQGVIHGDVESGAGGDFRAWWSTSAGYTDVVRVRVRLVDATGLESEPVEADLEPPDPAGEGDPCDEAGAIVACPDGMLCDRRDGDATHRCQVPVAECPAEWDVRELGDAPVEADDRGAPDLTRSTCARSLGAADSPEHVYRYRATRDGPHRFLAEGPRSHPVRVFVRRFCGFPRGQGSELACARADRDQTWSAADVDLRAGETVYVFVHHNWDDRGPYRLSVQ